MLNAAVEVDEEAYRYQPADNGAGPLWCYGSTCLVRAGDDVFMSARETRPDLKPLSNCRWNLLRRTGDGWRVEQKDEADRTREPCPLAVFRDGRIMMSVNPSLAPPDQYSGPAEPRMLQFSAADPAAPFKALMPRWEGAPAFTEHSYRGMAADGERGELLLLNILGHECYHWSFLDAEGRWSAAGKIEFPWGADYETPEAVRLCYPNIALEDRAVHIMAISDVIEPVAAWKQAKFEVTGLEWDYEFRRLFYCWTPDLARRPFSAWQEVASHERTCGHISNRDVWVHADGGAHLLWIERNVDMRIRDRFFPDEKLCVKMVHAVMRDGRMARRDTLAQFDEGSGGDMPLSARLHATADGRLFVLCAGEQTGNSVMEILPDGSQGESAPLDLAKPLANFMTATVRGGSPPSDTLDVMGQDPDGPAIRYVRVRLN